MGEKNYYQTLGVDRSAAPEEIKRAYRRLVKQFHPDTNPHPDAARKFTEIDRAHDTLIDPALRRRYDHQNPPQPAAPKPPKPAAPKGPQSAPPIDRPPRGISPGEYARNWPTHQTKRPHRRRRRTEPLHPRTKAVIIVISIAAVIIALIATGFMLPRELLQKILIGIGIFLLLTTAMVLRILIDSER
ncbi:MAG: J domain-containing protein [Phycisphaerales bacterium]|jgi:hypothetical protein|nr:J domain-containing protein [Phycisphaerales bacterium]